MITAESKVKCRFCEDLGTILTNINLEAAYRQYVFYLGEEKGLHEPDINTHGKQATDTDCHEHSVILAGVGLLASVRLGPQFQPDHCDKCLAYLTILSQEDGACVGVRRNVISAYQGKCGRMCQ